MNFTKTIKINFKRFGKEDVVALWRIVEDCVKRYGGRATIEISNDSQSVSSECDDIFNTNSFLKKRIRAIQMSYYGNDSSRISVYVDHSDAVMFSLSKIRIEGSDESWVSLWHQRLQESVDGLRAIPLVSRFWLCGGAYVLYGAIGAMVFNLVINVLVPYLKSIMSILSLQFVVVAGLLMALFILGGAGVQGLRHLFPAVEIDVNGDYARIRGRVSKILIWVITCIVVPVLLALYLIPIFESWHKAEDPQPKVFRPVDA